MEIEALQVSGCQKLSLCLRPVDKYWGPHYFGVTVTCMQVNGPRKVPGNGTQVGKFITLRHLVSCIRQQIVVLCFHKMSQLCSDQWEPKAVWQWTNQRSQRHGPMSAEKYYTNIMTTRSGGKEEISWVLSLQLWDLNWRILSWLHLKGCYVNSLKYALNYANFRININTYVTTL